MSQPLYGRYQVAEPPHHVQYLAFWDGNAKLQKADHEPKCRVLDQSDLTQQGIFTDELVAGAPRVAQLGSCTANTWWEHASTILSDRELAEVAHKLLPTHAVSSSTIYSPHTGESCAVVFYADETSQTGDPATEWPPTDCGSSGPFIVEQSLKLGVGTHQKIAHRIEDVLLLLQQNGVMCGSPFFYSWEEPDKNGFIDGLGRASDLEAAIQSGVAGGHEYHLSAIEDIEFFADGSVNLQKTVIRFRNHWTRGWGDGGSGRVHASTLAFLGGHNDYRQIRR